MCAGVVTLGKTVHMNVDEDIQTMSMDAWLRGACS